MKNAILLMMITACFGASGCSSLGELVTPAPAIYSQAQNDASAYIQPLTDEISSKSFQVFNNNPYALHLEFAEADLEPYQTPVNGDGGASLNAYAACLTLKVMF